MTNEENRKSKNEELGTDDKEDVDGYAQCNTHKQKCNNDCWFGGGAILSNTN